MAPVLGPQTAGTIRNHAQAKGISADGSVIFGMVDLGRPPGYPDGYVPNQAVIWDVASGVTVLGDLEGGRFQSRASGSSFSGAFVFGTGNTDDGAEAFIWDEVRGMRELDAVFAAIGLDTTGWDLGEVESISDNGTVIAGTGFNSSGEIESWIAVIPEPSTALLVGVGLVAIGAGRRTIKK